VPFKNKEEYNHYMKKYRLKSKIKTNPDLQSFLHSIEDCASCKASPVVFITSEKIPLCEEHWSILAESDIEFGDE
jgi:hypothetical protein